MKYQKGEGSSGGIGILGLLGVIFDPETCSNRTRCFVVVVVGYCSVLGWFSCWDYYHTHWRRNSQALSK